MIKKPYITIDPEVVPPVFTKIIGRNKYTNNLERYLKQAERKSPDLLEALDFARKYQGSMLAQPAHSTAYIHGFTIYGEALSDTAVRKKQLAPKIGSYSIPAYMDTVTSLYSDDVRNSMLAAAQKNMSDDEIAGLRLIAQSQKPTNALMDSFRLEVQASFEASPFVDEYGGLVQKMTSERNEITMTRTGIFVVNEPDFVLSSMECLMKWNAEFNSQGHYLAGAADSALMHYGPSALVKH